MDEFLLNPSFPRIVTQDMVELIDHFDYPIDIKDAWTGKYIRNNLAASEVSGLSPEERLGMDIQDIAKINRIKDTTIAKVVNADQQVVKTGLPASFNHIFLNKDGSLLVDKVVKKPILGQQGRPIAILSYAYTVTQYIDLAELYAFYRTYYNKRNAVQRFLKHLHLEREFIEPPTDQELFALLVIQKNVSASKYVAKLMNLSPRTIEEYKSRLRSKLRTLTFEKLLSILRSYGRYENIIY
jgi:hypothetical protein